MDGDVRTYRVSRIRELKTLEDRFARPPGFDLAAYWRDTTRRLEAELHHSQAVLRLTPAGLRMLEPFTSPYARACMQVGEPDEAGGRIVVLPVGAIWHACSDILRFAPEAEVLSPPELRAKMPAFSSALTRIYAENERQERPASVKTRKDV